MVYVKWNFIKEDNFKFKNGLKVCDMQGLEILSLCYHKKTNQYG